MSSLLVFWISIGIWFLIIEMIMVTFYGLAISFSAFVVALYVWYFGWSQVDIMQWVLFAVVSFFSSYFFPKWLSPKWEEKAQWLDIYIGETKKIKLVWEDCKVTLDGIDYLVDVDWASQGSRVKLMSRKWSLFYGTIVK